MRTTFDNSILSDFKKCMRLGYYRHVRGWRPEGMQTSLVFGRAWHAAMDLVWSDLCGGGGTAEGAFDAFIKEWTACGAPYPLPLSTARYWGARNPEVAKLMLEAYIRRRRNMLKSFELVECEGRFNVPLITCERCKGRGETFITDVTDGVEPFWYPCASCGGTGGKVSYVGRRDKIIRTEAGDLVLVEHKTTALGSKSGFREDWVESWHNKAQLDGYRYSYPTLSAVWIDAALVHSAVRKFEFIGVRQDHSRAQAWLWETRYWVDRIQEHWAAVEGKDNTGANADKRHHFYLPAFPKNDEACLQYNRLCPHFNTCKNVANPESLRDPPRGMRVEFWEPEAE